MHPEACHEPSPRLEALPHSSRGWGSYSGAMSLLGETDLQAAESWACAKSVWLCIFSLWCPIKEKVWRTRHCRCDSSLYYLLLVQEVVSAEVAPGDLNLITTRASILHVSLIPSGSHSFLWPPHPPAATSSPAQLLLSKLPPMEQQDPGLELNLILLEASCLPKFLTDELIVLHPLQAVKIKRCCSMSTEPFIFFSPLMPCLI